MQQVHSVHLFLSGLAHANAALQMQVSEGIDVLTSIGAAFVDDSGRPLQNIRIRHTHILDDPFPDPPALEGHMPEASPEPEFEQVINT